METPLRSLSVLVLLVVADSKPVTQSCEGNPSDVVFLLDASNSIWEPDFRKQLEFVQKVVSTFPVGQEEDHTRVGVLTFSHYSSIQIPLNAYSDMESLQKAVASVHYQKGVFTNTQDALKTARLKMFSPKVNQRPDSVKLAVVITDGQSQESAATQRESMALKATGVQVFAIGVGAQFNSKELRDIASQPPDDFTFTVNNYDALDSIKDLVSRKTCHVTRMTPERSTISFNHTAVEPFRPSSKSAERFRPSSTTAEPFLPSSSTAEPFRPSSSTVESFRPSTTTVMTTTTSGNSYTGDIWSASTPLGTTEEPIDDRITLNGYVTAAQID